MKKKRLNFEKGKNNTLSIKYGKTLLLKVKLSESECINVDEANDSWKEVESAYDTVRFFLHLSVDNISFTPQGSKISIAQPYIYIGVGDGIDGGELEIEEILEVGKNITTTFEKEANDGVILVYTAKLD